MKGEGKIRLALGCKDSGRRKTRIIDEDWIGITFPIDRVGRIGYDRIKRFFIPVLRMRECISMSYIKLLIIDVVEKHIDTTEIVGSDIDLLPEKPLTYIFFSENFRELQEERSRTTAWIIDFVHLCFSDRCDLSKELTHFLRREKFTSRFSGI